MTRPWFVLVAVLLSGCAALVDPAGHGTPWMRAQWAKAAPQVALCDRAYPNEMSQVVCDSHGCLCKTDRNPPMGESYYAEDRTPARADAYTRFKLLSASEAIASIGASVKAIASARCMQP